MHKLRVAAYCVLDGKVYPCLKHEEVYYDKEEVLGESFVFLIFEHFWISAKYDPNAMQHKKLH